MWDRTRENLINILQVPAAIRNDSEHEMWSSWNDEKLKSSRINLVQRQNRYQVHDLQKCDDCQQLFDALEEHKVWTGGDPSKRSFGKTQSHLFKPIKKDGSPSTNFILVGEKLRIQQRIRSEFSRFQFTTGYETPPEDWLEEFVRRDDSRHAQVRKFQWTW